MPTLAYRSALAMLHDGLYVLCVPGTLDGEPIVVSRGYKLPRNPYVKHPCSMVRAGFAWGALMIARRDSARDGVVVNG